MEQRKKACPERKAARWHLSRRGFTLIELLIVIAIIAILAVIVVVAINPTKILQKSRDSQRFSDVTSLATAINLYLADAKDFTGLTGPYASNTASIANDNARKKNDGTGWIPIDFTTVSSGAPLSSLPIDPLNNATYYYNFGISTTNKTYEINTKFEHTDNVAKLSADGGDNAEWYEVGTDLTILP